MIKRRCGRSVVLGMAVVLSAAACGGGGETPSAAADLTGPPVRLMVITPTDTNGQNFPEVVASVRASARAINARGGIGGGPVEILYCNERNDPVAGEQCAREAVSEEVVAVVGWWSAFSGAKVFEVLEGGGIPVVAGRPTTASDFSSPMAFNVDGGTQAAFALCPQALVDVGSTSVAWVRVDIDSTAALEPVVKAGFAQAGLTDTGLTVRVPTTTTDFSAIADQIADSGADGVVVTLPDQQAVQLLQTLSDRGSDTLACGTDAIISPANLVALGDVADSWLATGAIPLASDDPDVVRFRADLQAEADAGDEDADPEAMKVTGYRGWVGPQIVEQLATGGEGELTSASLVAALRGASEVDAFMYGTVDFTQPGPVQPSMRNYTGYLTRWSSAEGGYTLLRPELVDARPVIVAAAGLPAGGEYDRPTAMQGGTATGIFLSPRAEDRIDAVRRFVEIMYDPATVDSFISGAGVVPALVTEGEAPPSSPLLEQAVADLADRVDYAVMPDTAVPSDKADALIRATSVAYAPGVDAQAICAEVDAAYS